MVRPAGRRHESRPPKESVSHLTATCIPALRYRHRMGLTNPWLAEPPTNKQLDRPRLEERILNLLSSQNMCVLATADEAGPIATPVRYFSLAFSMIFTASPTSPKMRNIANDPRVSIGVFAPLVGLASSRGAQIFGSARRLLPADEDFGEYWAAFRWQSEQAEQGHSVQPPADGIVAVDATRIVYTEHWLRRDGYAPRQHWTRLDDTTSA